MMFQDNWENMNDLALNHSLIPSRDMEIIYNSATGYNIINEN
jgi:hypothetical protein